MDKKRPQSASYDQDVVAWANEQAQLIRSGAFARLDIENIADEIDDVGRSEKRELASRMAVLLAKALKWQHQPDRRSASWRNTMREQRRSISRRLSQMPSLMPCLGDPDWIDDAWVDALAMARSETGLDSFPDRCPWDLAAVLQPEWFPDPVG